MSAFLKQTQCTKTDTPLPAENKMIMDTYVERFGGADQPPRDVDVGATWRWIARRVIV